MTSCAYRPATPIQTSAFLSVSSIPESKAPSTLRRNRISRSKLKALPNELSAIDVLMIRHGQLECGPGARPIVPRCMTALPENFTEFLESLLPQGG